MGGSEGKEEDWECGGCENRNYAFRSFCNRCNQPRLLVDSKTPADSKRFPRIGDWICIENQDIRESIKTMLKQEFYMFNHVQGESLESQINRFTYLMSEMKNAEIELSKGEINRKLLNSICFTIHI